MVVRFLKHIAAERLFEVVTLLHLLAPLPPLLTLESWAVSKREFSPGGAALLRLAYCKCADHS